MQKQSRSPQDELVQRRAAARRTAWRLAVVAGLIFLVFFMTGVIGRGA
jgi:hypothetical protein